MVLHKASWTTWVRSSINLLIKRYLCVDQAYCCFWWYWARPTIIHKQKLTTIVSPHKNNIPREWSEWGCVKSSIVSQGQWIGGIAQGHLNNLSQIFYRFTDKKVSLCCSGLLLLLVDLSKANSVFLQEKKVVSDLLSSKAYSVDFLKVIILM